MLPILLDLGAVKIPAYGFFTALGYLTAILWLRSRRSALGWSEDQFWFVVYGVFIGALLGGKLMFLAVEYRRLASVGLGSFSDLRYGFVFFGGFFGASLAGLWCCRRKGLDFLAGADQFAPALALGHAIGRLGCLASGCCHGAPTTLPWGLRLGGHPLSATPPELWGVPLHPVQLYESGGNLLIALFLARAVLPRCGPAGLGAAPDGLSGRSLPVGSAFVAYMALYPVLRFGVEFLRGDDRGIALGLSTAQWTALGCLAFAAWAWTRLRRRRDP
ncbi:MAG: prolipoprotein diacylglyceryl transferase [Elusimicrobiota bacterium]|jgi:phosphatidylglycerol:prolipoprotein diacylglycerol transferase